MELLQTIWNALTNENEILMNIISVPMAFIEATLTLLLFSTILHISISKKQIIEYSVSATIFGLLILYLIPSPFYTFINILLIPFLVYLFYVQIFLKP